MKIKNLLAGVVAIGALALGSQAAQAVVDLHGLRRTTMPRRARISACTTRRLSTLARSSTRTSARSVA